VWGYEQTDHSDGGKPKPRRGHSCYWLLHLSLAGVDRRVKEAEDNTHSSEIFLLAGRGDGKGEAVGRSLHLTLHVYSD